MSTYVKNVLKATSKDGLDQLLEAIVSGNMLTTYMPNEDCGTPEVYDVVVEEIKVKFISKWNPPHLFYDRLEENGISIEGHFYDKSNERTGICTKEHYLERECYNDPEWLQENMAEELLEDFNLGC